MPDRTLNLPGALLIVAALSHAPVMAQTSRTIVQLPGREHLGSAVNSPDIEIAPVISPDGTTLYFDRKYSFDNTGGTDDDDDIYYSTLGKDGTWSPAKNIGPPLNTPGSDVLFWIAPDGEAALVHNGGVVNGRMVGLAISRRKGGAWGAPMPITIDGLAGFSEVSDIYSACIAPDGSRLILALADSAQSDNLELFSCPALGSDYLRWGEPRSLGATINSIGSEWGPSMGMDNRTLYFVSEGRQGKGSSDIYMTRRIGEGWETWTEPVNLGDTVNTTGYEVAFSPSPDGTRAWIAAEAISRDDTYGKTDIFRVRIPSSLRPLPFGMIAGRLRAKSSGAQGLVRVVDAASGTEVGSTRSYSTGAFRFLLPSGVRYKITGWAAGYRESAAEVELKDAGDVEGVIVALRPEGR
jgi:hypothetical protein